MTCQTMMAQEMKIWFLLQLITFPSYSLPSSESIIFLRILHLTINIHSSDYYCWKTLCHGSDICLPQLTPVSFGLSIEVKQSTFTFFKKKTQTQVSPWHGGDSGRQTDIENYCVRLHLKCASFVKTGGRKWVGDRLCTEEKKCEACPMWLRLWKGRVCQVSFGGFFVFESFLI